MKKVISLSVLAPILFASQLQAADIADIPVVKPQVKTIAAFKNGLGFVFKSAKTNLKDGYAVIEDLPAASLGALWIGNLNSSNRIEEVLSYKGKAQSDADAMNMGELVEANVGKTVFISYGFGNTPVTEVSGVVLPAPKPAPAAPVIPDYAYDPYGSRYPVASIDRNRSQIVLIKNQDQVLAINKSDIRSVRLQTGASLQTKLEKEVNSAKVRVAGNPSSAEITMAYLEKGITWSPDYLVNIRDPKMAEITLDAVLMNDAEDVVDADVSFVVGYPNFMYANIPSPMLAQQSVASFVRALENGNNQNSGYGGVMAQSMAFSNVAAYDYTTTRPNPSYTIGQPMAGEENEDLFFYHQQHVTLNKGDRARYNIFTNKVPYEHVYVWDVPDRMYIDNYGHRSVPSDAKAKEQFEQVWHTIRLQNTSKVPWTTAPALTMNGDMPVAQDVLKYAPPSAKSTLRLTVATNVRAQQTQTELSRESITINHSGYQRVTVKGILSIKNYNTDTIKMQVKKALVGQVINVQQNGKAEKLADVIYDINPRSQITWEFDLKPGEEKQLDYQYSVNVS